jgi:type II secretory pathway pseudopilin PulG
VPLSDARLRKDPNIRLRCPHCGHVFPRQDRGRCAACGQIFLIPPAAREHVEEMRDRCIRISRAKRERLFRMQRGGGLLASRRMRRTLAIVSFVVLGVLLPLNYMLRKTGGHELVLTHDSRTRQTLGVLRTKLECFRRDCGRYPTDREGLWALALNPGATNWCGPYLTKIPPDLWRHRYYYGCSNDTVSLWSSGPDGIPHTADDIQAPPPDLVYVVTTATNGPPQQVGEDTVIEIVTTKRARELLEQARTNRPAGREEAVSSKQ